MFAIKHNESKILEPDENERVNQKNKDMTNRHLPSKKPNVDVGCIDSSTTKNLSQKCIICGEQISLRKDIITTTLSHVIQRVDGEGVVLSLSATKATQSFYKQRKWCEHCEKEIEAIKITRLKESETKGQIDLQNTNKLERVLLYALKNKKCGLDVNNFHPKFRCNKDSVINDSDGEWQKKFPYKKNGETKYKTVDIFIKSALLCIEVDGIQHITNKNSVWSDLWRTFFNLRDNGFLTVHVPNSIFNNAETFNFVVDALKGIISLRQESVREYALKSESLMVCEPQLEYGMKDIDYYYYNAPFNDDEE